MKVLTTPLKTLEITLAFSATLAVAALAVANSKLILNGKVASTDVRVIGGTPYVRLSDVARALDMVVVKRGDGYEIKKAGGATPIQGLQGKIGDVLFDGKWRFQVLSVQTPDSFAMKTQAEPYGQYEGTKFNGATRVFTPQPGYKLVIIQCRVTNGQNTKQTLWTALGDKDTRTALADTQGGSHPPVAYDFEGAPIQTQPLVPGAIITFPVVFSVPQATQVKDLIFTLKNND